MKRKKLKIAGIAIIIAFLVAEIVLRTLGFGAPVDIMFSIKPKSLFQAHEVLGWKPQEGEYDIKLFHEENYFKAKLNKYGERVSSDIPLDRNRKSIDVYGCSCTFGLSIPDSLTQCYQLQKMISTHTVNNKGVPGYGLTQMYLSLKESVLMGDTPTIAIFNYAGFHDVRTFENIQWGNMLYDGISQDRAEEFYAISYPSYYLEEDELKLKYTPFASLSTQSFWNSNSVVIKMAQDIFNMRHDWNTIPHLQKTSQAIEAEIFQYCLQIGIIPVFGVMTNNKMFPFETTLAKEVQDVSLKYSIDFGNNQYNCSPYDNTHPNGLAHKIFAQEMYSYLLARGLI